MNIIEEAFRELNAQDDSQGKEAVRLHEKIKKNSLEQPVADPIIADLFDQVYSSLTDPGDNRAYKALGKLCGKGHYDFTDLRTKRNSKPGFNSILVYNPDLTWAKHIAEVYGLESKVTDSGEDSKIEIFIPANAERNSDLLAVKVIDKNEYEQRLERKPRATKEATTESLDLDENVESSMPVTILPHDQVKDYIENVPVATQTTPPTFFKVGYIHETPSKIKACYKGGRGSEGNPYVRVFKCSEMTVYTGADYEHLKATKAMRKETGKERSGERTGFSFAGDDAVLNKIGLSSKGEEQLQCYVRKGTRSKVKYFISLDDEDLRPTTKEELAQYFTPGSANILLNGREEAEDHGQQVARLKLSGIYMIGNLGHSVM